MPVGHPCSHAISAVHPTAAASRPVAAGVIRAAPYSGSCCPAIPGYGMADRRFRARQVVRYRADLASVGARAEGAAAAESAWVAAAGWAAPARMGGADVRVEPAGAWAAVVDAPKDCAGGTRIVRCNTDPSSPLR